MVSDWPWEELLDVQLHLSTEVKSADARLP